MEDDETQTLNKIAIRDLGNRVQKYLRVLKSSKIKKEEMKLEVKQD